MLTDLENCLIGVQTCAMQPSRPLKVRLEKKLCRRKRYVRHRERARDRERVSKRKIERKRARVTERVCG